MAPIFRVQEYAKQETSWSQTWNMQAIRSSEWSGFFKTTQRCNSEAHTLQRTSVLKLTHVTQSLNILIIPKINATCHLNSKNTFILNLVVKNEVHIFNVHFKKAKCNPQARSHYTSEYSTLRAFIQISEIMVCNYTNQLIMMLWSITLIFCGDVVGDKEKGRNHHLTQNYDHRDTRYTVR